MPLSCRVLRPNFHIGGLRFSSWRKTFPGTVMSWSEALSLCTRKLFSLSADPHYLRRKLSAASL